MSTTRTYKDRYNTEPPLLVKKQEDVELEIIVRLIAGEIKYQRLIITHTCQNMFTNQKLKEVYGIVEKFLEENDIKVLTPDNLILFLQNGDLKYTKFINYIFEHEEIFTHSGDAENWLIWLHQMYASRLYAGCKKAEDFKQAEEEIAKYKFQDLECNLFDVAMKYDDEYETKSKDLIKTYYPSIDKIIGGFQGGNLMIMAAATGMGKTAMALNFVVNMAKNNKKVLLFSLEMTQEELLNRIIAIETGISSENLRNRNLSDGELKTRAKYIISNDFFKLKDNIIIPAQARVSISTIEEIVRQSNADIIFIDYLGLIQSDIRTNIYEQISDISRRLKLLAIETNKPFIVLHQLNRDVKNRSDKHPTLSDIRDSGKIEQDSDFISFIFRPAYYDPMKDKTEMEFILAKSRHSGGSGNIAHLSFNGKTQKIYEILRY